MSGHSQVRDGSRGAGDSDRVGRGGLKQHPSLLTFVQVPDASFSLWGPQGEIYNTSALLGLPNDCFCHMNG